MEEGGIGLHQAPFWRPAGESFIETVKNFPSIKHNSTVGANPSMAVAFHTHGIDMLKRMPLRIHPTALVTRYRPFLKDSKAAPAPVFRRVQAFFLRIFPDDMDRLSIRKSEAGSGSGRTVCTQDT
jgi:hypothetical protein